MGFIPPRGVRLALAIHATAIAAALPCVAGTPITASAQTAARQSFQPLREDGNGIAAFRRLVVVDVTAQRLSDVIRSVQQQAGLSLAFGDDLEGLDRRVTLHDTTTAAGALLALLSGTSLEVLVSASGQAVIAEREPDAVGDAPSFTLTGAVRDGATGLPVSDAEVWVDDVHRRVLTDAAGRYRLPELPSGPHSLVVRRPGYREEVRSIDVRVDTGIDISLEPQPTPLAEVIVSPGVFGVLEETVASRRTLTRSEIEAVPQIGEDIFRSVTRLPGVVGNDLSAAFGVRGSSDGEVLLRLDGIELIEPYHLKDVDAALSIVDLDAIGGVELSTGGFGPQYGDRLAGVFEMRTLDPAPGRPRTTLGISLTNLRAATTGTFGTEHGSWLVTARRGYLDLALKLGGSTDPISPVYYDVLGKVEYEVSDRLTLAGHVLHAGDRLEYQSDDTDPDLSTDYGSSYAWLTADARAGDRLSLRSVLSAGRVTWDRYGRRERDRFNGAIDVTDVRDYDFLGFRQEATLDVTPDFLVRGGVDIQTRSADYDYDGVIEHYEIEEGTRTVAIDSTRSLLAPASTYAGAWLSARVRPAPGLTVETGARLDRHTHTGDTEIGPRFNIAWSVDGRTTIRAAWGLYAQAHGLHELQAESGESLFAAAEHAEHRVAGIERSLPNGIDVRLEAFDRRQTDLRPRWVNLDNDSDFLPEATSPRARIDPTDGFSRGIELLARHRAWRGLDWSITYALSESRQTIDDVEVPGVRDQRHALALDGSWGSGNGWRFAAAWQFHSGWPRTPATMVVDTIDNEIYASRVWGDYNTERLPAYHRLDVRISREIVTRRGRLLLLFDVYNLYGRENARGVVPYVSDIRNGRPVIRESINGLLPRLPSFGVQWTF